MKCGGQRAIQITRGSAVLSSSDRNISTRWPPGTFSSLIDSRGLSILLPHLLKNSSIDALSLDIPQCIRTNILLSKHQKVQSNWIEQFRNCMWFWNMKPSLKQRNASPSISSPVESNFVEPREEVRPFSNPWGLFTMDRLRHATTHRRDELITPTLL